MQAERWEQIKTLFEEVLQHPTEERASFLEMRCTGDEDLRSEVNGMLQYGQVTNDFLEHPPFTFSEHINRMDRRLQTGDMLCGRFKIDEFLGRGGMGEVYAAYDSELREFVALKTIRVEFADDEQRIGLLRKEVQRARRIVHPGVGRVYDIFTHSDSGGRPTLFITMQLLRGEMLDAFIQKRGPLPADEALRILEQISAALTAAHSAGIVHRDLKSANIFLVDDEHGQLRAVITDFGLACEMEVADSHPIDSDLAGGPAGTLTYMAPEQLEGEAPTIQADLYAFGLLAYELVAGCLPFAADNPLSAAIKRSRTPPPPPSSVAPGVTAAWDHCITRALDPNPKNRFSSASEFVRCLTLGAPALRWQQFGLALFKPRTMAVAAVAVCLIAGLLIMLWDARARASGRSSIAVLPFANATADPATEYLSDGITEEVINVLAKLGGLRVVSRNSSFRFKGQQSDLHAIARTLDAEMIMTGSVRRSGEHIRVTVELVDPYQDSQVWSRTYDGEIKDVFKVQDEIATLVADSLRLQIGRGRLGTAERRTRNMEAFDLYLQGRYQAARRDESGLRKAVELLQEAIAKDPYYAVAHVELGNSYLLMADYGISPSQEVLPRARASLLRSIELEPELADGQAVLGQVFALFDWDWQNADRAFRRAIELNHNYAPAYHWRAQFLARLGRWDEAMADMHRSLRLDPVAIPTNTALGWLYFYNHRFSEAKRQAEKTLDLNPYFVHAHLLRGQAAAHLGLVAEAKVSVERTIALASDEVLGKRYSALIYALVNMREDAFKNLAVLRRQGGSRQAAFTGYLCAYLGLADEMFKWLNLAYESRDPSLTLIKIYPAMDAYRQDSRYVALLDKLKIPRD